jgi:hypothetical protein
VSLSSHAQSVDAVLEYSDLPKPNPDGIDVSQLLMSPILTPPPPSITGVVIEAKMGRDEGPYAEVECSAWCLTLGGTGRIKTEVILPYPVEWKKVKATYDAGEGVLRVRAEVMREEEGEVDVGSRAWSLKRALEGERKKENEKKNKVEGKEEEGEGMKEVSFLEMGRGGRDEGGGGGGVVNT